MLSLAVGDLTASPDYSSHFSNEQVAHVLQHYGNDGGRFSWKYEPCRYWEIFARITIFFESSDDENSCPSFVNMSDEVVSDLVTFLTENLEFFRYSGTEFSSTIFEFSEGQDKSQKRSWHGHVIACPLGLQHVENFSSSLIFQSCRHASYYVGLEPILTLDIRSDHKLRVRHAPDSNDNFLIFREFDDFVIDRITNGTELIWWWRHNGNNQRWKISNDGHFYSVGSKRLHYLRILFVNNHSPAILTTTDNFDDATLFSINFDFMLANGFSFMQYRGTSALVDDSPDGQDLFVSQVGTNLNLRVPYDPSNENAELLRNIGRPQETPKYIPPPLRNRALTPLQRCLDQIPHIINELGGSFLLHPSLAIIGIRLGNDNDLNSLLLTARRFMSMLLPSEHYLSPDSSFGEWPAVNFSLKLSDGMLRFPGIAFTDSWGEQDDCHWDGIRGFISLQPILMFSFVKAMRGEDDANSWKERFVLPGRIFSRF